MLQPGTAVTARWEGSEWDAEVVSHDEAAAVITVKIRYADNADLICRLDESEVFAGFEEVPA